jgi:serine/threonine-protein phosphatase 2A activator
MYKAEVLSKFPVVQHFPFGSLFPWEKDPDALAVPESMHSSNQPSKSPTAAGALGSTNGGNGTQAPWAQKGPTPSERTAQSPWAPSGRGGMPSTQAPWAKPGTPASQTALPTTQAPWATSRQAHPTHTAMPGAYTPIANPGDITPGVAMPPTQAPWARQAPNAETSNSSNQHAATKAPWAK